MTDGFGRRDFLKGAVAGVATTTTLATEAQARSRASSRQRCAIAAWLCLPQSR